MGSNLISSVDIKNAVLATPLSKDGQVSLGKTIRHQEIAKDVFLDNCFVDVDFISQDMLMEHINSGNDHFALSKIEDFDYFAESKETQKKYKYLIKRRSEAFQKELFEKDLLGAEKNDLEHRTYSTIFLIEGPAGCGKTTYANYLLRNSFAVDFCDVETATQRSCGCFSNTYDFKNPRLNPVTAIEMLLLSKIHERLAKKSDESIKTYRIRLKRICEIYYNQFNSDKISVRDSLEFRQFFEQLFHFSNSDIDYNELSDNLYKQIDDIVQASDIVINGREAYEYIFAIKYLLGILMRIYFCLSRIDGNKYILFLDNIERYIISETGTPYITIFDIELQKIVNSFYSIADEMEDIIRKTYEAISKNDKKVKYQTSFGVLIATRESTLSLLEKDHSFSEYFERHHSEHMPTHVNISNWFDYYKVFMKKVEYFTGIIDEESNLFTHTFKNILADVTLSKWSLRGLLLNLFNNNFRRFFENMTEVFCNYEDVIKYYNQMWDKAKDNSIPGSQHVRHLCRKIIIRIVLDYMQNVNTKQGQRGFFDCLMARCDVEFPNNDMIAKSSYARRIITYLDNMNNDPDSEPVSFPSLVEVLLHRPMIKNINKSNVSINDRRIDDIAEILDIASQTAKIHTNGVELVILNVNSSQMNKIGLSTLIKEQWTRYRTTGIIDNYMYNIKVTPAGSVLAMLFPCFEYFVCRYKNNSIPLFMLKSEDQRRNLIFGTEKTDFTSSEDEMGIFYKAMNCIDSVLKYETRMMALSPINKKNPAANAIYAEPKWLYKYGEEGKGMVHALRIIYAHIGYLHDYREFLACTNDDSYDNMHYRENDGLGVIDEAIDGYKRKYNQILEHYRSYLQVGNTPNMDNDM